MMELTFDGVAVREPSSRERLLIDQYKRTFSLGADGFKARKNLRNAIKSLQKREKFSDMTEYDQMDEQYRQKTVETIHLLQVAIGDAELDDVGLDI